MIIKNESNYQVDCYCPPAAPLPMVDCPVPGIGIIYVESINGLSGRVVLKSLIFGDKTYNGSSDIEITPKDLGLETSVKYCGSRRLDQIQKLFDAEVGELYYCITDDFYYLSIGEGEWKKLPSDKITSKSEEEILKLREDLDLLRIEFDNLSDIARTGNVNDLLQDDGDVLILDCSVKI